MIKKVDGCKNNSEKSSKTEVVEHILCGYLNDNDMEFWKLRKKNDVYRDDDCMKKFRNKQQEFYEKTKICYISKKTFEHKYK